MVPRTVQPRIDIGEKECGRVGGAWLSPDNSFRSCGFSLSPNQNKGEH